MPLALSQPTFPRAGLYLDLVAVTGGLAGGRADVCDDTFGSDHRPIMIELAGLSVEIGQPSKVLKISPAFLAGWPATKPFENSPNLAPADQTRILIGLMNCRNNDNIISNFYKGIEDAV